MRRDWRWSTILKSILRAAAHGLAVYTHDVDFDWLPGVEVVVLR